MIRIFYGDDRVKTKAEINRIFGDEYEVLEGEEIENDMFASIFQGALLFADVRKILIKDLGNNKEGFDKIVNYINTPHNVIIWESKLDKRTNAYKVLKDKVEIKEFAAPVDLKAKMVFDIYLVAKRDGKKAVKMLEEIEAEQDPFMFLGLLVSQAMKDFSMRQGSKEKRVLQELSKLDMEMKTTQVSAFLLLKSFLLRLSSL